MDFDFFETENRFFLGGIVEARAEHKNFLTKYHRSFCSNFRLPHLSPGDFRHIDVMTISRYF